MGHRWDPKSGFQGGPWGDMADAGNSLQPHRASRMSHWAPMASLLNFPWGGSGCQWGISGRRLNAQGCPSGGNGKPWGSKRRGYYINKLPINRIADVTGNLVMRLGTLNNSQAMRRGVLELVQDERCSESPSSHLISDYGVLWVLPARTLQWVTEPTITRFC